MSAQTYIIWLHIHSKCVDYSSKISFWELYLFHEAIFKSDLKNPNDQLEQSSRTLIDKSSVARNSKIVSDVTAPLRVTRGIERTFPLLSRKPSESVKTKISTARISKTKTNFSKIPSKLFSGLQNLVIEVNLSRRFS